MWRTSLTPCIIRYFFHVKQEIGWGNKNVEWDVFYQELVELWRVCVTYHNLARWLEERCWQNKSDSYEKKRHFVCRASYYILIKHYYYLFRINILFRRMLTAELRKIRSGLCIRMEYCQFFFHADWKAQREQNLQTSMNVMCFSSEKICRHRFHVGKYVKKRLWEK